MTQIISIEELLDLRAKIPVIDVRTPEEYKQGHIPEAINLPIFNHEERAKVGITYKHNGREKAILVGFDIVGPKWRGFIEQALKIAPNKEIIVHCWRGGMRSNAMAWALDFYGFKVHILNKGYKTFRSWVLNSFQSSLQLTVLGGMTGTHKTEMLHELKNRGRQMIDLEGLTNHEGSAFGTLGFKEQPTQEQFENNLALLINSLNPSINTWIEDESRTIGKRVVPEHLWQQMQQQQVIEIQMNKARRFDFLLQKYGSLEKDFLEDALQHISKRLGPLKTQEALQALTENRMEDFISITMTYYDKAYHRCLDNKKDAKIIQLKIQQESIEECVDTLLQIVQ